MKHRHRAKTRTDARCYTGPVAIENQDPMAHGGIAYREICRCGAERPVNQNQRHVEYGEWDGRDNAYTG